MTQVTAKVEKEVVAKINALLDGVSCINRYDIQCVIKVYGVKKRPEFYYKGKVQGSPSQYSHEFVEWIVKQYNNDNTFFTKARQKAQKVK